MPAVLLKIIFAWFTFAAVIGPLVAPCVAIGGRRWR